MEDKIFELLEKMYSEFLEFRQETNALFDGYKQSVEGIEEINTKLDKLTDRVENQEIKLQLLK